MITVYTKNRCVQCSQTKKYLKQNDITFKEVNIEYDEQERSRLLEEGWLAMPVVKIENGESWSGFRPDKLTEI